MDDTLKKLKELQELCRISAVMWENDQISVGDFTYGRPIVHQWDKTTRLTIGKFCSIAGNVHILLGGEHHTEWITTYPFDALIGDGVAKSKGNVTIGNDVWIGENVTILSGVTIGDGAVIGAGSVVAGDVLPYQVVVGNPGTSRTMVKRYRIQPAEAVKIWKLSWWDWPLEKIAAAIPMLMDRRTGELMEFDRKWRAEHDA